MHKNRFVQLRLLILLPFLLLFTNCGYNKIQIQDEQVDAAWSEVLNQYQRRADLIPNLVNVVQGYASHEREVLTAVADARSRIGQIQATPELVNDEAAMQRFIDAQGQMGSALSRLMMVAENYPNLKADGAFRDLQAQLEGTENRIAVARNRYIQSVQAYNVTVRTFPATITARVFGYERKANFKVENEQELAKPPEVQFN